MTVYTRFVDYEGLARRLNLEAAGPAEIELELPTADPMVCSDTGASCPMLMARAVLAFRLFRAAVSRVDRSEEGDAVLWGSEYLPMIAFEKRSYEAALDVLAEKLAPFDEVVGYPFRPNNPEAPMAWVGGITVEVHGNWVTCGHIGKSPEAWRIVKPACEDPSEEGEEDAPSAP